MCPACVCQAEGTWALMSPGSLRCSCSSHTCAFQFSHMCATTSVC
uniref:Uncharacterized protein n=1 Tax=Anguilla anguilla TaxID=7936 RepID=A0A0E9WHH3_ANGAN